EDKTVFSAFYTYGITQNPKKYADRLRELSCLGQGLVDGDRLAQEFMQRYKAAPERAAMDVLMPLQVIDWMINHRAVLDI
ncbi:MAG: hypothetical protein AAGI44_18965, partial [Pseudomonadota bacterium]